MFDAGYHEWFRGNTIGDNLTHHAIMEEVDELDKLSGAAKLSEDGP